MQQIAKLHVKDLMRKARTVREDTSIPELVKTLENNDIDAVAVVDKNGRFIGDVHESDLLKLLIDPKDVSWEEVTGIFGRIVDMGYFAKTARDLMHRHEITVTPETTVREAVSLMFKHNLDVIPVVDKTESGTVFSKEGKLLGMITELDILDAIYRHYKKARRGK